MTVCVEGERATRRIPLLVNSGFAFWSCSFGSCRCHCRRAVCEKSRVCCRDMHGKCVGRFDIRGVGQSRCGFGAAGRLRKLLDRGFRADRDRLRPSFVKEYMLLYFVIFSRTMKRCGRCTACEQWKALDFRRNVFCQVTRKNSQKYIAALD